MRCAQCGLEQADGSTHCAQCGSLMAPPIKIGGLDAPAPIRPSRPERATETKTKPPEEIRETQLGTQSVPKWAVAVLVGGLAAGWLVTSGFQMISRWLEPAPKPKVVAEVQAPSYQEPADTEPQSGPPPAYLPEPAPVLAGPPAPDSSQFTEEELRQRRLESLRNIPPELRPHLGELPQDREIHFVINEQSETPLSERTDFNYSPGEPLPLSREAQSSANCNQYCAAQPLAGRLARQNCLNNCLLGKKGPKGEDHSASATGCEAVCGAFKQGDIVIYTNCISDCLSGRTGAGSD